MESQGGETACSQSGGWLCKSVGTEGKNSSITQPWLTYTSAAHVKVLTLPLYPPKNGTHFLSCLLKYLPCTERLWRSCAVWEKELPRALCPSCCNQSVLYFYTPGDMCSCSLLITHTHKNKTLQSETRTEVQNRGGTAANLITWWFNNVAPVKVWNGD